MQKINIEPPELDFQLEEAYKTLRTNLQFCGDEIKAVNITSCLPDEGKTTVSVLLARSLAESEKKVLLLDADMRNSSLSRILKTHEDGREVLGLSHWLSGQAKMEEVLYQASNIPGMYMIFSGLFPPNPSELLENSKFNSLLTTLRKSFDYVIVDTPPLGTVIDSAIVASKCDGSILVIQYDTISRDFAKNTIRQLKKTGKPLLGIVLNKADDHSSDQYKYYAEYYYKAYGENKV